MLSVETRGDPHRDDVRCHSSASSTASLLYSTEEMMSLFIQSLCYTLGGFNDDQCRSVCVSGRFYSANTVNTTAIGVFTSVGSFLNELVNRVSFPFTCAITNTIRVNINIHLL